MTEPDLTPLAVALIRHARGQKVDGKLQDMDVSPQDTGRLIGALAAIAGHLANDLDRREVGAGSLILTAAERGTR